MRSESLANAELAQSIVQDTADLLNERNPMSFEETVKQEKEGNINDPSTWMVLN